jgi:methylated-DNA-protein-cysteine methyltransferase-like protein
MPAKPSKPAPRRKPARIPLPRIPRSAPIGGRPATASGAYARILAVVRRIPRGKVATYGQVAALAGYPRAPRLAGYALHALPPGTPVPWHRVLGAGGKLSLARLSPDGAVTQRLRLAREGVAFDALGGVDLEAFGWRPGKPVARARPRR